MPGTRCVGYTFVAQVSSEKVTQMVYAKWDPTLETGNELVDSEHRELLAIINELQNSIIERHDREIQDAIMVRLMAYARDHFKHEEELMRSVFYPGLVRQKQLHKEFAAEARRLMSDYESGRKLLPITLAMFLHEWLVKHIRGEDRKIGEYIRERESHVE